jgi:tetratricopeptide (TPR) repeat protein
MTTFKKFRLIALLIVVFSPIVANAQTTVRVTCHYPKLHSGKEMDKVKTDIALMLKYEKRNLKDILVLDDRIEYTIKDQKNIIYFSDVLDDSIQVKEYALVNIPPNEWAGTVRRYLDTQVEFGKFVFTFKYNLDCVTLADNLYFIQYQLKKKRYDTLLALFKPIASQYCALKIKPSVSEEQRKYIVQANSFSEEKMYNKAIELYNKAIKSDQTAYPAAYSNLALLSAQAGKYDDAIYYMKIYMMLDPDAPDARGAQDKIYEWEAHVNN